MLLTLANITHDAQKERRERLKQKYGDKTQLPNTGDVPLQRQSGDGHDAETKQRHQAGAGGTHAKFQKTRKQLLFFSMRQGGMDETAVASVCVCVNMQNRRIQRTEADRRRQPAINI